MSGNTGQVPWHAGNGGGASVGGAGKSEEFVVDTAAILCGRDTRTTVMVKNVPNKYSKAALLELIDRNHGGVCVCVSASARESRSVRTAESK